MRESLNRVYALYLPPCIGQERLVQRALQLLSEEKRERLHKMKCRSEYNRILFGDLLVRHILSGVTGHAPEQLHFLRGPYGKPHSADHPAVHFNLSHAGDYAVCAVSDGAVGIDVEQTGKCERMLARQFFHQREADFLDSLPESLYPEFFFRLWTLKEAYLKYRGTGLSAALNSVSFIGTDGIFYTHGFEPELCTAQFRLPGGYFVSVCGKQNMQGCICLDADTLLQEYGKG